ncbi:MAG: PKD domain-containing protein [Bacteroidota bacterium]
MKSFYQCYLNIANRVIKILVATILLILAFSIGSKASHIVGGEIGYRCLGGGNYEITLNVYRDCLNGAIDAQFDDPAFIGIFNGRTGQFLQQLQVPFMQDDTLTGEAQNRCLTFPSDVCVHTSTYIDTVQLQTIADGYQFVYQRCCRNMTIQNIIEPLATGATYDITLTEAAMLGCNSTPRFKEWPPIFVCVDEPIFYDHGAIDADGDSLVYRLCTPFTGATLEEPRPRAPSEPPYNTLNWVQPLYNLDNILGATENAGRPLRVDPDRGFLFARPSLQGQFVVGVCVEEYRNGELLSRTRRDFQYNIGQCVEINAAIGAPEVQCDDLTVEFESLSEEATEFIWKFDLDDASATSTEENPSYTYPDTGRYTIQLIVEPDEICSDTFTHEIYLQQNSIAADLLVEAFNCGDSTAISLFDVSEDSVSFISERSWQLMYAGQTFLSDDISPSFLLPNDNLTDTGTVRLFVESFNGCTQMIEKDFFTDSSNPIELIADELTLCQGDSVHLNPMVDSLNTFRFRWRPGIGINDASSPNPKVSPPDTTTYTVRVFPASSICQVEKEVTVNVIPTPELFDFRADPDCFNGLRINFSSEIMGADSILWNFGDSTNLNAVGRGLSPAYTYPDTGAYQVQITVFGGACIDTLVQNIVVEGQQGTANFSIDAGNDIQTCTDSVTLSARTRNVARYFWLDENDSIIGMNESIRVAVAGADLYRVRAEDFSGCFIIDSISVVGNRPQFNSSGDVAICEGEDLNVFVQNLTPEIDSLSYQWTSNDTIFSGANTGMPVLPSSPGVRDYKVLIMNEFGCQDSLDLEVAIIRNDLDIAFDANVQCDGSTVEFINQSNDLSYRYRWLLGDSTNTSLVGDSIIFNYDQDGSITACLTLDYNVSCNDTICEELTIRNAAITADFSVTADSCSENSTTLFFQNNSIDTAGLTYTWTFSDGTISNAFRPIKTFTESQDLAVQLTVEQGEDCVLTQSDSIPVRVLDVAIQDLITICSGSEIQLNPNGNPDLSYRWTPDTGLSANDIASPMASPAQTTDYVVSVFDRNNPECSLQRSFTIEVTDGLDLGFPDVLNICEQETLLSVPDNINAAVTWTDKDGNTNTGNSVLVPADYTGPYFVEAIDTSGGCSGSDTLQIRNENGIDIIKPIGDTINTCEGQTVLIILENGRPQDDISISYFPNDRILMGDSTLRVTYDGFQDTILSLNYIATNQFGCVLEDSLIVKIREFTINLPPIASVCTNAPTTINPNFNPQFNYVWSPTEGLSDPNSGNPDITIGEPRTYSVTVTNGEGAGACRDTREIEVGLFPEFNLNSSEDVALCEPDDVTLTAEANTEVEYEWSDQPNFEDILNVDAVFITFVEENLERFYVRAIDTFGCQKMNQIDVRLSPVDLSLPDTSFGCFGQNFTLNAINNGVGTSLTFEWMPEDILVDAGNTANPIIRVEEELRVSASAINEFGCTDTVSTLVSIIDLDSENIVATAAPDTIFGGEMTQLNVNLDDNFAYTWSPAEGLSDPNIRNPLAMPTQTTTYTVEISQGTCRSTKSVTVVVNQRICDEPFLFVPAAFTPNGDDENDVLFVRGQPIDELYFAVYNRWGQKVFETEDKNVGWDGRYQGRALAPDVFGYYLEITCFNGDTFFKRGDVSIIR